MLRLIANAFDEDRKRCLAAGVSDRIGKPVDPNAELRLAGSAGFGVEQSLE